MASQVVVNVTHTVDQFPMETSRSILIHKSQLNNQPAPDALLFILPLLIVLSTFLFILLLFLVCVIFVRRRRGIVLRDSDGPTDMSREELIDGEGGFEGVESRWLESVSEGVRRSYLRAKEYQLQYAPNSEPTDITLSQFLSIQEKGVSAWSFEPDYETINSLLVHARTEITFLPDPASASCVQSNLPLPKLNEVYYWEVKMFDLPETTIVAVGLATKPYPPFRLPGLNPFSVAYHSNGDKCYNYPFTASPFGPVLKEGDVLGIGYRPRTGTVFFTRNGRKMEDAFIGLNRYNLFPTIGADGPCSVHVNLGQAGFVFIEANVKKWGLAPTVGTLAPPPAYGSERGSILLDVGGGVRPSAPIISPPSTSSTPRRRSHRSRRPSNALSASSVPVASSPLRGNIISSHTGEPSSPPPPITPIIEEPDSTVPSSGQGYLSPTDLPFHTPPNHSLPLYPEGESEQEDGDDTPSQSPTSSRSQSPESEGAAGSDLTIQVHPPPDSPRSPNPPTPNQRDIRLQAFTSSASTEGSDDTSQARSPTFTRRDPPAYSPLDAFTYAEGVHIDLPADVIAAALEGGSIPASAIGQGHSDRSERRRSRRDRR
ncbi:SPRY-domain-containing protein [Suillus clintonianus]|uniref:SPRY-domain-containing protein n=1 Tax=Suillus clintonianus TaxID=1904413 RepID=UPI001B885C8C|nr:SPRY-domain-containing protein [Suillus clintonianus]KAG2154905.1 SPRY-domain-containing protein [Suillus clintonianus]